MEKHLVVAKFKEDVSWIKRATSFNKIYLYDKSGAAAPPVTANNLNFEALPNIGRESHSYIYHVLKNYSNLPDILVLAQGWPFDHCPDFLEATAKSDLDEIWESHIKAEPENKMRWPGFIGLGHFWTAVVGVENSLPLSEPRLPHMQEMWKLLFDTHFPAEFPNTWGAVMVVSRWRIRARPRSFYKTILDYHEVLDRLPWALEYLWPHIWCHPLPRKLLM